MATQQVRAAAAVAVDPGVLQAFGDTIRGDLIQPDDARYNDARQVWNAMIDLYPSLIARCAGAADVIAAVRFAREHGLLVSIRGGGHNVAGKALCDGGLVIDLSMMKGLRIDPVARTARAEPGLTWAEFDRETQAFGLATTGGVVGTTGIAGLTLGGGQGWLNGKHGLTCDNLLSADIVTADGHLLHASATSHPDLFWALRGGGGNFGIVTSFEYRLHPQGQVLAGPVFHPVERAGEVLCFHREFVASAPDELTIYAGFLTDPDGNKLVALAPCYVGDIKEGEQLLRPLREFGPPLADLVGPMDYTAWQKFFDPAFPAGRQNYWKSSLLPELSDGAIETIVQFACDMPSPLSTVFIHHYHGAYSRVDPTATAYGHRTARHDFIVPSQWSDPADVDRNIAWTRAFYEAMQPHATRNVFPNFLSNDESQQRIRDAYGVNYDRLVEVKNTYDPTNFFRVNQNIHPTV